MQQLNLSKLKQPFFNYASVVIQIASIVVLLRIVEFLYFGFNTGSYSHISNFQLIGLKYDIRNIMRWSIVLLPLFFIKKHTNTSLIKKIVAVILFVLIVIHLSLIEFYNVSGVLLGEDFFTYSFSEMIFITKASSSNLWLKMILKIVISLLIIVISFILKKKIINAHPKVSAILFSILLIFSFTIKRGPNIIDFSQNIDYDYSENKTLYFIKSLTKLNYKNSSQRVNNTEIRAKIKEFQNYYGKNRYINNDLPFY